MGHRHRARRSPSPRISHALRYRSPVERGSESPNDSTKKQKPYGGELSRSPPYSRRSRRYSKKRRSRSRKREDRKSPQKQDNAEPARNSRVSASPRHESGRGSRSAASSSHSPLHRNKKRFLEKSSSKASQRTWKFDSPPRDDSSSVGDARSDIADIRAIVGLSCEQQKAARELYVGNLPPNLDVNQLIDFFNAAMLTLNSSGIPGNPVSRAWIAADGHFAFVEFRTIEEATIALQLNGLNCMGYTLRIGRPKTYPVEYSALLNATMTGGYSSEPLPAAAALAAATAAAASVASASSNTAQAMRIAQLTAAGLGIIKKPVIEKPERLILLDLPPASKCAEQDIEELLRQYGTLKVFQYFEIPNVNQAKTSGVCIFEYSESGQQKALEKAVRKESFGNLNVRVMPAEQALRDGELSEAMEKLEIKKALGGDLMRPQVPTRVIMLTNIITRQELINDSDYFDILEDIKFECQHYGKVIAVEVPRPGPRVPDSSLGYAFVKFAKLQEAGAARKALSGRKFAGRTVEAHYFNGKLFEEGVFDQPSPNYDPAGRLPDEASAEPVPPTSEETNAAS